MQPGSWSLSHPFPRSAGVYNITNELTCQPDCNSFQLTLACVSTTENSQTLPRRHRKPRLPCGQRDKKQHHKQLFTDGVENDAAARCPLGDRCVASCRKGCLHPRLQGTSLQNSESTATQLHGSLQICVLVQWLQEG